MFSSEQNVRVRSGTEPEPPFGFMFGGFAEPNPEHYVQFGFEHCSQCSEPDRGQSTSHSSARLSEDFIMSFAGLIGPFGNPDISLYYSLTRDRPSKRKRPCEYKKRGQD